LAKWIEPGWFLDLSEVPKELRPPDANTDFVYVQKQEITRFDRVTAVLPANLTTTIDFSSPDINKLKPMKDMMFQVAWGFYPDALAYAIHPTDNSVGKLPKELPSDEFRVGTVTSYDSSYDNPNIEKTELFLTPAEGCYTPKFVFLEDYGRDTVIWLALQINMLKLSPITDEDLINALKKHVKPSYPVRLFMWR